MSIHSVGTPISISEVNAELGTNNIQRSFSSLRELLNKPTGPILLSDAYGKSFIVTHGSQTFNVAGTHSFIVPLGITSISVTLGGGGGGGGGHSGNGGPGGTTTVGSISAYGGGGGGLGWSTGRSTSTPGIGGGGIGGTGGGTGANGLALDSWGSPGGAGSPPGGNGGTANAGGAGGGGGGSRYGTIAVMPGQNITVIVGAGGLRGSPTYYAGQPGIAGQCTITW